MTTAFADLETMWHEHHANLLRYAKRYVGPDMADDIVQDAFCNALKAMLNGKGYTVSAKGWLYRLTKNLIIDYYRERDRKLDTGIDDVPDLPALHGDPVRSAEITEVAATVDGVLAQLNDTQHQALRMRYLDGCEFNEIAEAMDKDYGAVKSIVGRGLDTANLLLGGDGRARRTPGRHSEVEAALRQHGPMTISEIAAASSLLPREVRSAIYANEDLFCRVGAVERGRVTIYVWGVAGLHHREAA